MSSWSWQQWTKAPSSHTRRPEVFVSSWKIEAMSCLSLLSSKRSYYIYIGIDGSTQVESSQSPSTANRKVICSPLSGTMLLYRYADLCLLRFDGQLTGCIHHASWSRHCVHGCSFSTEWIVSTGTTSTYLVIQYWMYMSSFRSRVDGSVLSSSTCTRYCSTHDQAHATNLYCNQLSTASSTQLDDAHEQ